MLPWGQTTLLGRMVEEMKKGGRRVYLSVRAGSVYGDYQELCIQDRYPDRGPLEGMGQVIRESKEDAIFFCAVDMPWVDGKTVDYLDSLWDGSWDCVIMEDKKGIHPLCGIYGKQVLLPIERQLRQGDGRVMNLLKRCRVKKIRLEETSLPTNTLTNVNTRQLYEQEINRQA